MIDISIKDFFNGTARVHGIEGFRPLKETGIGYWTYRGSVKTCSQEPSAPSPSSSAPAFLLLPPAPFWLERWVEKQISVGKYRRKRGVIAWQLAGNIKNSWKCWEVLLKKRLMVKSVVQRDGQRAWDCWRSYHTLLFLFTNSSNVMISAETTTEFIENESG